MNDKILDVVIVGAGLSGLATAHFLKKLAPEKNILILEKESRVGGAIQSMREDGFLAEWGPHGFLDNVAESRELLADLPIGDGLQKAPLKQFVRHICLGGKLVQIPQTPPKIIKSNVLPLTAKLRVLGDLVRKPKSVEQSVADWATYRFGKSILPFADIVMTGTYAGDIEKLSIDATMPGLRRLEHEFGSVLKGAIKTQKEKKGSSGLPSMISFKNGMEQLITLLAERADIQTESPVLAIEKKGDVWKIRTPEEQFSCHKLVFATHINQALPVLNKLSAAPRQAVNQAIIYNIALGFEGDADIPFGFGYLAPKSEKRFALGTLFSIHMFPGRAPNKMKIVEVLVGGTRNPEHLALDDETLKQKAFEDIRQLINFSSPPVFQRIIKPKTGIPQLEMGHREMQTYREKLQDQYKGLLVSGFGWEAIGMNDMIKQARETVEKLLSDSWSAPPAQAKGIYF